MTKHKLDHSQAITQQGIADIAGCSQNTVALALKDSPRISKARREQIRKIADKHGYRPYIAARGLRQGRSGLIGMFGTLDPIRTDYVQNVMNELHGTEYKPVLGIDFDQVHPWHQSKWIDTLLSLQVEALICFAWYDEPVLPLWSTRIPIIMCGFSHDKSRKPLACDTIVMDRFRGVSMAIDHLVSRGHERIYSFELHYGGRVSDSYPLAMQKQNLTPTVIRRLPQENSEAFVTQFVKDYKAGKHKPTAMFVLTTGLAVELYYALTQAGIRVPEDIELVGYDRAPWICHLPIPITTVEQPVEEMTASTIHMVMSRLRDPSLPHMQIEHDLKLVVRR